MLSLRCWFTAVVPLILFISLPQATMFPVGDLRPDNAHDIAPHAQTGKNYNEIWTYQLWLNNGVQAQINLSRAFFGSFKDPVCGTDFALMGFRNQNYFVAREYPSKNFVFDSARTRLSVHEKIFFEGLPPQKHRLFFSTVKKDVSYFVDLTFSDMIPGAVWGDGIFHLNDNQSVGLFFHIPKSRVHGRIALNGDTLNVDGFGWMDHTWQTGFATKLINTGYRYDIIPKTAGANGRIEDGYFFDDGSSVFGYGLREDGGHWTLLRPKGIKTLDQGSLMNLDLPKRLEIVFDKTASTRLQRREDRQQTSALQELSKMERFAARMFLGGQIYGLRGTAWVDDSLPAIYSITRISR